jgi:DNA-directed RNA polymerase specialized sigma24 family protein
VAQESRRKAHAAEPLPEAGLELFDGQPHLDTLLVAEERRAGLWHAVMQLPEEDRRLIVALFAEERERCEIARESGIGNIGVNVRLCRTLKRLRAQILQQAPAVKPARRKTGCTPFRTRRIPARGARSANRWATMAA